MSFDESQRFPEDIAYGSQGGPEYNTTVVKIESGHEKRNINWAYPLNSYDVAYGVKTQSDLYTLINFFHAAAGRGHGFRFKDHADWKSCTNQASGTPTNLDQIIGSGDGTTTAFQLVKIYTSGTLSRTRKISKPVSGTVLVAIGGKTDQRWSVDTTTGIVTFSADLNYTVTNATSSGSNTIITIGTHSLVVNDSVWFDSFTGDWAGLNNTRFIITAKAATTITVAHNSSAYAAYSTGSPTNKGETHTIPQTSTNSPTVAETITAGYEFDVPCRFDSDSLPVRWDDYQAQSASVTITEIKI